MNWLADIVLVVVAALIIYKCTKMGFFKAVTNFIKLGASIILTALFGKYVSDLLYNKLFYPKVYDWVSGEVNSLAENANNKISDMLTDVPEKFQKLLDTCGVSLDKLKATYIGSDDTAEAINGMSSDIASPFARLLSNVVGYLLLFIAIIITLTIVCYFLNKLITKLPVIKCCNSALGFVFGIACAFLAMCICAYILTAAFGFFKTNSQTIADKSIIYQVFYKIDLLNILKIK